MEEQHEVFTLIEEITRNDGTKYYEIGNMVHNGRAELAAERGYIKEVRILKLNIPHSQNVINYEHFIKEWKRNPEADQLVKAILRENRVG